MNRPRPSVTHAPGHSLPRTGAITNTPVNDFHHKTEENPSSHIGDKPNDDPEGAGQALEQHAMDASYGGLAPGSSSKGGGLNPYHTSALSYPTILQDQPKYVFKSL